MSRVLLSATLLALATLGVGCGPKVDPQGPSASDLDTDMRQRGTAEPATAAPAATPISRTGTIERASLIAVLDAGPGAFLRDLDLRERLDGERFIGWELVGLAPSAHGLRGLDLATGDLLLAVNGRGLPRPAALFALWSDLRTATEIVVELDRAGTPVELRFAVVEDSPAQTP